ncbi:hypothetical protein ACQI5H_23165 [Mycobacterium heidelbergense]|uniref:hypothetical protein n=1 Tax=Mycobacterium heidelbergense TaxID=53376 RepID=UPI003CEE3512
MASEPEPLENLVARRIREQLGEGGLDRLIQAQEAVQKSIAIHVPAMAAHASMPAPTVTVTGGMATQLQPLQTSIVGRVDVAAQFERIPPRGCR